LPVPGAVLDLKTSNTGWAFFAQSVHHRPMAFGNLSRRPASVVAQAELIQSAADADDFATLRTLGFRLLVVGSGWKAKQLPVLYRDRDVVIYDLTLTTERPR